MKYILPIILTFLINLPTCGMVFAGWVDESMYHPSSEMASMNMREVDHGMIEEKNTQFWIFNCCPNASKSSMERDTNTYLSFKDTLITSHLEKYPLRNLPKKNNKITANSPYRSNAPPDPGEYISLIGSSVKKLN